jgi:hypothetical protein
MSDEKTEVAVTKTTAPAIQMGNRGVELSSMADAWEFANAVLKSGLAPKGLNGAHAIMIAVQMGAEVGLPPMASLQNIAVINGRPSVWGDAMLGICRASGLFDEAAFEEIMESEPVMKCTCIVRRLPDGKPTVREFTMDDAKLAGLKGKAGPWSQYPKRMLQMRARSWALRDAFADVLRGLQTAEETRDYVDVVPIVPGAPATSLDELTTELSASHVKAPFGPTTPPPDEELPDPPEVVAAEAMKEAADGMAAATTIGECTAVEKKFAARWLQKHTLKAIGGLRVKRVAEIKASRGQNSNPKPEPEEVDFAESDMLRTELCQRLVDGEPVPVIEAEAMEARKAKQLTQVDCEAVLQAAVSQAAGMSPEQ